MIQPYETSIFPVYNPLEGVSNHVFNLYGDIITDDTRRLAEYGLHDAAEAGPNFRAETGEICLPKIEQVDQDIAHTIFELREGDIEDVRSFFVKLKPAEREFVDKYLEDVAPQVFKDSADKRDWATQLGEASTDRLLGFIYWNAAQTATLNQDPTVRADMAAQRRQYKQLISQSIRNGDLPASSEAALDRTDAVPIVVGDVFSTFMLGVVGLYKPFEDVIVVSENAHPDEVFHELNHAALGKLPGNLLNEAYTTHALEVMKHGQPNSIFPNYRPVDSGIYSVKRATMAQAQENGRAGIPSSFGLEAYCEYDTNGRATIGFLGALAAANGDINVAVTADKWYAEAYKTASLAFPHLDSGYFRYAGDVYVQAGIKAVGLITRGGTSETLICNLTDETANIQASYDSQGPETAETRVFQFMRLQVIEDLKRYLR